MATRVRAIAQCFTVNEAIHALEGPVVGPFEMELMTLSQRNETWDEVVRMVKLRGLDRDAMENVVPGLTRHTATRLFGGDITRLTSLIAENTEVTSIKFVNCWVRPDPTDVRRLFEVVLPSHPTVSTVTILFSRRDLAREGHACDGLLASLTGETTIQKLTLINYLPVQLLCRVINVRARSLSSLRLYGCPVGWPLREVANAIRQNPHLQTLSVHVDSWAFELDETTLETLVGDGSNLRDLRLVNVRWTDAKLLTIFNLLQENRCLIRFLFVDDKVSYVMNRGASLPFLSSPALRSCEELIARHNQTIQCLGPFANDPTETHHLYTMLNARVPA
jgi:hypothetical protein